MPISELIVRCGALALVGTSALYAGLSLLSDQARRRYAKPAQDSRQEALAAAGVTSMEDWQRLPTKVQEAADTTAINKQEQEAVTTDPARLAVEHVARINALTRF
jgi:glycine cleavage system pyridoxal-binding protein P